MDNNYECIGENEKLINDMYQKFICKNNKIDTSILKKNICTEDILQAKEDRVHKQRLLIKDYYSPLVSLRINYPGACKNNYLTFKIMMEFCPIIMDIFKNRIMYNNLEITAEGPVLTMLINEDALSIKKRTLEIENSTDLGRCLDIDVYDTEGKSISRKQFGMKGRKCYVCHEYASICARNRTHSIQEIKDNIFNRLKEYEKNKPIG